MRLGPPRPRARIARLYIGTGFLFLLVGLFLFSIRDIALGFFNVRPVAYLLVSATFLLYGSGLLFLAYLRGDIDLPGALKARKIVSLRNDPDLDSEVTKLSRVVNELKRELTATEDTRLGLSDAQRSEIIDALRARVQEGFKQNVISELESRYSSGAIEARRLQEIRGLSNDAIRRLLVEIEALARRGNLNLVIGTLTTAVAVTVLAYVVITAKIEKLDTYVLLAHYVPRLSLVIFIEVFSFFFLKLYRMSLGEIKYFQNEVTNLEVKFIALLAAAQTGNKTVMSSILEQLSKTERNFILKKTETTVELERQKVDQQNTTSAIEQISKIVQSIKPKGGI